jgi:hypothetical protein
MFVKCKTCTGVIETNDGYRGRPREYCIACRKISNKLTMRRYNDKKKQAKNEVKA